MREINGISFLFHTSSYSSNPPSPLSHYHHSHTHTARFVHFDGPCFQVRYSPNNTYAKFSCFHTIFPSIKVCSIEGGCGSPRPVGCTFIHSYNRTTFSLHCRFIAASYITGVRLNHWPWSVSSIATFRNGVLRVVNYIDRSLSKIASVICTARDCIYLLLHSCGRILHIKIYMYIIYALYHMNSRIYLCSHRIREA